MYRVDLVSIGDNTSIGTDTHMLGYLVEDCGSIFGKTSASVAIASSGPIAALV